MVLHSIEDGAGSTLVLAHGFTQNRNCWGGLQTELASGHRVVRVDLPGHGKSAYDGANLFESGRLLSESGPAVFVGYSMGGRVALHSALGQPDRVRALILIGVNPGIEDTTERQNRLESDRLLADKLERKGVDSFLAEWLQHPLFSGLTQEQAGLKHRRTNRQSGLAASLRHRSVGCQTPLWSRLAELSMPILLLAGEDDTKYRSSNARWQELSPLVSSEIVTGSHACHLQEPALVAQKIETFMQENEL